MEIYRFLIPQHIDKVGKSRAPVVKRKSSISILPGCGEWLCASPEIHVTDMGVIGVIEKYDRGCVLS
jgi:hypothetical protein